MTDTHPVGTPPRHVGYIVDGNRRWAKQHGLPTYEGHLAGYNALQDVALATFDAGVEYVSAYIFSSENWKRSQSEVKHLMGLTLKLLKSELDRFKQHNIRLVVLGAREGLNDKLLKAIASAEEQTKHNTAGTLALCFNYGGQNEIVDAFKMAVKSGVEVESITTETISQYIYYPDIPAVDVIVRTSGEKRISNFMLWRSAYSELIFIEKLWPDMTNTDVATIMEEYINRNRRFGK